MIDVDLDEKLRKEVERRSARSSTVNPWKWHHGSFEGVHIEYGVSRAGGDSRRPVMAVSV